MIGILGGFLRFFFFFDVDHFLRSFPVSSDSIICLQRRGPGFQLWVWKTPRRKKQQPTPVFLSEEFSGHRSLLDHSPQNHKESDTTEQVTHFLRSLLIVLQQCFCFMFWFLAISHVESQLSKQGSNLHPLHWKVKSSPLDCQGSPSIWF